MLDVRAASLGLREQLFANASTLSSGQIHRPSDTRPSTPPPPIQTLSTSAESSSSSVLGALPAALSLPPTMRISLQEMISTSIALKSGLDIQVVDVPSAPGWATTLVEHQSRTRSPSRKSVASVSIRSPTPEPSARRQDEEEGVPSHVALAIAGLQREILMLRSELSFELWMARENVKHIGRLYQDRVISRTAEIERQGLVRGLLSTVCALSDACGCSIIGCASTRRKFIVYRKRSRNRRSKH